MLTPERCLADVDSLELDAEAKAMFLGGNATRIFDLPVPLNLSRPSLPATG